MTAKDLRENLEIIFEANDKVDGEKGNEYDYVRAYAYLSATINLIRDSIHRADKQEQK